MPLSIQAKTHPPLTIPVSCLGKEVVAVCDQIRTVDKTRLLKSAGNLSLKDLDGLDNGLREVLAL